MPEMTNKEVVNGARLGNEVDDLIGDEISVLLELAHEHDAMARDARRAAGRLLGTMREGMTPPAYSAAIKAMGLDLATALHLVELGAGGRVRA